MPTHRCAKSWDCHGLQGEVGLDFMYIVILMRSSCDLQLALLSEMCSYAQHISRFVKTQQKEASSRVLVSHQW
jgi:hypothetical protein